MELKPSERLIVLMLADVMKKLEINDGLDSVLVEKLVLSKAEWGLDWAYPSLFSGNEEETHPEADLVEETGDILSMWDIIETSIENHGDAVPEELRDNIRAKFRGFDGNNDRHYHIAHTIIYDLGAYERFKDRNLNSHSQATLPSYRAMLPRFNEAMVDWEDNGLSVENLVRSVLGD